MSDVVSFGAEGDGESDDTQAIVHAIREGDGVVRFGRGRYRITRTIEIPLPATRCTSLEGNQGTAKIIMAGPGPAFRIVGDHAGTADPVGVQPGVWQRQRMPMISGLEIEGAHERASGIELVGTFQPVLSGVLLRDLWHGVMLTERNRNVLISDCQIYHNRGAGILMDKVNLHQINITGNHISYNRLGGIRIQRSEIRNLQITGNDIEYNNYRSHPGAEPDESTAEILIDSQGEALGGIRPSVRELTIASNTIQSTYSPGGANVRILGPDPTGHLPPGMAAISGNLMGNQAINLHLAGCRGIAVSGNFIYSGFTHNVLVEDSDDLTFGANSIGHNYWVPNRQVDANLRFVRSRDCVLNGMQMRGAPLGKTHWEERWNGGEGREHRALVELVACQRFNLSGCLIRDPAPCGIYLNDCSTVNLSGCQIFDSRDAKLMRRPMEWEGSGQGSLLTGNTFDRGTDGGVRIGGEVDVRMSANLEG